MKNSILPSVTSHAQLYCYGNNEAISGVPVQIDSKTNVYSSSFFIDSKVLYDDHGLLEGGGFGFPSQSTTDYQPGPTSLMTIKRLDYPYLGGAYIPQQPLSLGKKLSVPQFEANNEATQNARKRPIEVIDLIQHQVGFNNMVGNKQPAALKDWMTNKKKKADCLQEQEQCHVKEELWEMQRHRVPVRRSQKLSDRITALQKLVSPYGKTDTASVLQEASISIKALQDQIQKTGEKQLDLQSRGLCLVPVSFTQKLTTEEQLVDQHATSRRTSIPRNF
ncbi:hypothetical protein F0562_031757 [Nyssa sinensis]|uniref:BHLH domain-containing protein n=1 Tax=Nyssa sinensis TaxID=561372 RepID=A0A5J5AVD0_9ASTE|nr:hypothetical protein F0562_031757 [Nyssa sinensis]